MTKSFCLQTIVGEGGRGGVVLLARAGAGRDVRRVAFAGSWGRPALNSQVFRQVGGKEYGCAGISASFAIVVRRTVV